MNGMRALMFAVVGAAVASPARAEVPLTPAAVFARPAISFDGSQNPLMVRVELGARPEGLDAARFAKSGCSPAASCRVRRL